MNTSIESEETDKNAQLNGSRKPDSRRDINISTIRAVCLSLFGGTAQIIYGALISLTPPFYPTEAETRGATPSQYGFVFGITNLFALTSATLFGTFGRRIGAKSIYNFGSFLQGLCAISFGCLTFVDNLAAFLCLSYFLRALDGIADAAALSAMLSLLSAIYPDNISVIMAVSQGLFGVGYTLGPAIGSVLYSLGGFGVAFWSVGSLELVCAVVMFFIVPSVKPENNSLDFSNKKSISVTAVFTSVQLLVPLFANFIALNGNGILESMLEPHMKKSAGASQAEVGNAFLIFGGSYLVSSLVAGCICDRVKYPTWVSIIGQSSMAVTYILIGPVTFVQLSLTVPVIYCMSTFAGIGMGLVTVSSFSRLKSAILQQGFEDNINTYLLMSGMWTFSFYLGIFVGPTLGGIFVENYGFETTATGMFFVCCISVLIDLFELCFSIGLGKP